MDAWTKNALDMASRAPDIKMTAITISRNERSFVLCDAPSVGDRSFSFGCLLMFTVGERLSDVSIGVDVSTKSLASRGF